MPIDEASITPDVLNNTLRQEVYPEVKIAPGTKPKLGKVRTVYELDDTELLMISSDNLSTHDVVQKRQVYAKGANLDAISHHYFERTMRIIPNHIKAVVAPNVWLVQKAAPIRVEMVFRQYLTGSGWKAYEAEEGQKKGMMFCGAMLRPGYRKNEKLDELIFTPTAKGQVKDFNIAEFSGLNPEEDDPKLTADIIKRNHKAFGLLEPGHLDYLAGIADALYKVMHDDLAAKGWLFADTKWEFGYLADGTIVLIDECVTPDSSRFWDAEQYKLDPEKNEFAIVQGDKQPFRDYIEKLGLHKNKAALASHWMDDAVLRAGVVRYCNMRERITGTTAEITTMPRKKQVLEALAEAGFLR